MPGIGRLAESHFIALDCGFHLSAGTFDRIKALIRPLPFHRAPMQYQVELNIICNFDPSIKSDHRE
jgi:hypothetical protein